MNIKKIIILFFIFSLFVVTHSVSASSDNYVNAYLFYGQGCPHCAQEEKFLGELKEKHPELRINQFEIYHNKENVKLFKKVANKVQVNANGVPFLVIGDQGFLGYLEGQTNKEIEEQLQTCLDGLCTDQVSGIVGVNPSQVKDKKSTQDIEGVKKEVILPILGRIDIMEFSLPLITVVIGLLDGFNPCAMWSLLFLIGLLLGMKNRRRMWVLGIAFIFVSGLVYFIFMSAWLNLILFLGFITWVRIIIGLVALVGGIYSLYEFLYNRNACCKVGDGERKRKTFQRMKDSIKKNSFWLALGGIIILAFVVNLVELVCSAGFPAVYTQVLLLNNLSVWHRYLYLIAYTIFYMLDDILVFVIAMVTLRITGVTTKYVRASRLIGGLLMLAIGILLIIKPELLMFG